MALRYGDSSRPHLYPQADRRPSQKPMGKGLDQGQERAGPALSARWRSEQLDSVLLAKLHQLWGIDGKWAPTAFYGHSRCFDELLEVASWRGGDQDAGWFHVDGEAMRDASWREGESAWHGLKHEIAYV